MFLRDTNENSDNLDLMKRQIYESAEVVGDDSYKLSRARFMNQMSRSHIANLLNKFPIQNNGFDIKINF